MEKTSEDRRWERLQQQLLAEARGEGPVHLSSNRTLFGIKSHAEEVIDRTVAEIEQKQQEIEQKHQEIEQKHQETEQKHQEIEQKH